MTRFFSVSGPIVPGESNREAEFVIESTWVS
jgi:hypothetical protein